MKKASTLIRPRNWKSIFLVLFGWCLVGSTNAQTTLDLANDTIANDADCDLVDIQGPTCPETTIEYLFCENAPDAEAPAFTDCSEIAETSYNDLVFGFCGRFTSAERDTLVDLGFSDLASWIEVSPGVWQIPAVLGGSDLVESVILRSWVAVDTKGNLTENCLQIFANVSPASLALPTTTNITVSCGTGTSPEDLIGEQDINGITITADQVSPGGISPSRVVCGWITNYGDQEIEACGNSKKIIRTWTWLDWCAHTPVLLGPFIQIIEIIDDEAPTLTSGPSAMVRSGCMADITLGSAVWTDACGEVAAYRTELVKYYDADNDDEITKSDIDDIRAAGDILLKNNSNGGSFANLPIGTYWVLYFAIDECGNETNRLYEELDPDGSVIPANVHITTLTVANCPIIAPLEPMDLSVIDPCSCDNPLNTTLNGTLLFHDILTIITTPDVPVILSNTDNNLLDATGNPIPIGTPILQTTSGSGEYILEFYTLPEISAYISVSNGADTENFITASCSCPNLIPTMSQWGLLIFSLLILNLGIIFIGRIELA